MSCLIPLTSLLYPRKTACHLVLIDEAVQDYEFLLAGVLPSVQSLVLRGDRNFVVQLSEILARQNVASVSLVVHGTPGCLHFAAGTLNLASLECNSSSFQQLATHLFGVSLRLYSCTVAKGAIGQAFVGRLQELTKAKVSASTKTIGQGSDWVLDYHSDAEIIASPFQPYVLPAYQGILGSANDLFNQAVTGIPLALQKLSDSLRTQQSQLQVAALPLVGNLVSDNFVYDFISKIKTPIQDALNKEQSTFNANIQDPLQVLQQAIKQGLKTAGFPEDVVKFTTLVDGVAPSGKINYTQGDIRLVMQIKNLSYEPEVKFNKIRDLLVDTSIGFKISAPEAPLFNETLEKSITQSSKLTLSGDFGVPQIGLDIKPRTVEEVLGGKPSNLTDRQWNFIKDRATKISSYELNAKVAANLELPIGYKANSGTFYIDPQNSKVTGNLEIKFPDSFANVAATKSILPFELNLSDRGLTTTYFIIPFTKNDLNYVSQQYVPPSATNTGLTAQYFGNPDLLGLPVMTKVENTINQNWYLSSPNLAALNTNYFSTRWSGQIAALSTGTYTFTAKVEDGVRLWVNGQQIINSWGTARVVSSYTGTIALQQGQKYDLVMEYQQYTDNASAQLSWTPPGGQQQIIPATVLTPTLSGVKGEYFNGTNEIIQSNPLQLTKTDATLDIATFSPGNGVDTRYFAVRWTGLLNVTNAGDYQFHATFNDGGRVWIDGQLVIDRWIDLFYSNRASSQKISLEEGQHNIQVEYFNDDRNSFFKSSSITLEWEGPNINRQEIPSDRLTSLGTQRVERGFLVEYFLPEDKAQLRPIFKRVETTMGVDRDQTLPQAIAQLVRQNSGYNARWTGEFEAPFTGTYKINSNVAKRDYGTFAPKIDGQALADFDGRQGTIFLEKGKHTLKFTYTTSGYSSEPFHPTIELQKQPFDEVLKPVTTNASPTISQGFAVEVYKDDQFQGTALLSTFVPTIAATPSNLTSQNRTQVFNGIDYQNLSLVEGSFSGDKIRPLSIRWSGKLEAKYTGFLQFTINQMRDSDQIRIWINGQEVTLNQTRTITSRGGISGVTAIKEKTGRIDLIQGQTYDLKIEYAASQLTEHSLYEQVNGQNVKISPFEIFTQTPFQSSRQPFDPIELAISPPPNSGLKPPQFIASYYYDTELENGPVFTQTESKINQNWGDGSPSPGVIRSDLFSVTWQGTIQPTYTENYTFTLDSDEGSRLFLDGKLVYDNWNNQGSKVSSPIKLEAGKTYNLKFDYYDNTGPAFTRLYWQSASQPKTLVSPVYTPPPSTGVQVEFFKNLSAEGLAAFSLVSNSFGEGVSELAEGLGLKGEYSVRWTGQFVAPTTGNYTFLPQRQKGPFPPGVKEPGDSIGLILDGTPIYFTRGWDAYDQYIPNTYRVNGQVQSLNNNTVRLEAGKTYTLQMELFHNYEGETKLNLDWARPDRIGIAQPFTSILPLSVDTNGTKKSSNLYSIMITGINALRAVDALLRSLF
ncbi:PA14 domain-containing protein, partial [Nostoc sp.]|uniref:PA14 domain-containing protein n=1 Tax=Nostoc sp. TaxID=1180 RepID=UPI002FF7D8CC